jgi:hypothetical protein
MKKIIIAISGLLLVAVVVIKVASAQSTPQDVKKAPKEARMDCGKCPVSCAAKMGGPKTTESKVLDPAKFNDAKGDTTKCKASCATSKDGKSKCDPAKCKEAKCDTAKCKAGCGKANEATKK